MLKIIVPPGEQWDDENQCFIVTKEQPLQLEHSLVSLSKWEATWCKPLLSKANKSYEEIIDYIRCMTITQNVDPSIYNFITNENISQVNAYIDAPMTAVKIQKKSNKVNTETVTSELIYYWMISFGIPFECQKWHLNRLLALIDVCNLKNQPPKKMSRQELMSRNVALNSERKKLLRTRG